MYVFHKLRVRPSQYGVMRMLSCMLCFSGNSHLTMIIYAEKNSKLEVDFSKEGMKSVRDELILLERAQYEPSSSSVFISLRVTDVMYTQSSLMYGRAKTLILRLFRRLSNN